MARNHSFMDTVEEIMRAEGVSANEARKIQREQKRAEAWEIAQRHNAEELEAIAAKHGVGLNKAQLIRDANWAEVDVETYRLLQRREQRRERYWQRVEDKARADYAKARGIDVGQIEVHVNAELEAFRVNGKEPSAGLLRIEGARDQMGTKQYRKLLDDRLKWRRQRKRKTAAKSKRQSAVRETKGLKVSPTLRAQVLAEEDRTCRYCGGETDKPQIDHILPELGNVRANLTVACRSCNSDKSDKNVLVWAQIQGPEFFKRASTLVFNRLVGPRRCDRCDGLGEFDLDDVLCVKCEMLLDAG